MRKYWLIRVIAGWLCTIGPGGCGRSPERGAAAGLVTLDGEPLGQ